MARQLEEGDLREEIATNFSDNKKVYTDKLTAKLGKQSNTDRVVKNWAVLMTVYQLLSKFLSEMEQDYILPDWQDVIVESVRTLRQERASEVFLDILGQLIAGGQAILDDDMKNPREYPSGVTVIGYKDENFVLSTTRDCIQRSKQSSAHPFHHNSYWDAIERRWDSDTWNKHVNYPTSC